MKVVLFNREVTGYHVSGTVVVQMDLRELVQLTGLDPNRESHLNGRTFEIKPEWNLRAAAKAKRDELVRIGGLLGRLQADVQTMLEGLDAFEGISGKGKEPVEAGAAPEAEPM